MSPSQLVAKAGIKEENPPGSTNLEPERIFHSFPLLQPHRARDPKWIWGILTAFVPQRCHSAINPAGLGKHGAGRISSGSQSITNPAQQWDRRQKTNQGNESRSVPSLWWESLQTQQDLNPNLSQDSVQDSPEFWALLSPQAQGSSTAPVAVEPRRSFCVKIQNKLSHELHTQGWAEPTHPAGLQLNPSLKQKVLVGSLGWEWEHQGKGGEQEILEKEMGKAGGR